MCLYLHLLNTYQRAVEEEAVVVIMTRALLVVELKLNFTLKLISH